MIRIVSANPLPGFRLKVAFDDGLTGIFSVEPERRGGVFLRLLTPGIFDAVTVNSDFGCVEWPGGIDLCPTTMHDAIASPKFQPVLDAPAALHDRRRG
jgi:hypothetical protein